MNRPLHPEVYNKFFVNLCSGTFTITLSVDGNVTEVKTDHTVEKGDNVFVPVVIYSDNNCNEHSFVVGCYKSKNEISLVERAIKEGRVNGHAPWKEDFSRIEKIHVYNLEIK
jgi:hypothetical protein